MPAKHHDAVTVTKFEVTFFCNPCGREFVAKPKIKLDFSNVYYDGDHPEVQLKIDDCPYCGNQKKAKLHNISMY